MNHKWYEKVWIFLLRMVAKIHTPQEDMLSIQDRNELRDMLAKDYYILASRRDNYLTTFLINFSNFLLTGKWGFYSHCFMNLEDAVSADSDFRFIEATGKGVHYSTFAEVMDPISAIALIKPKNMSLTDWTAALDEAKSCLGRPYDNLFNLKNDLEINCVELIYIALKKTPNYFKNFAEFEKLAQAKKKLTPDMFVNCSDFEVVYHKTR